MQPNRVETTLERVARDSLGISVNFVLYTTRGGDVSDEKAAEFWALVSTLEKTLAAGKAAEDRECRRLEALKKVGAKRQAERVALMAVFLRERPKTVEEIQHFLLNVSKTWVYSALREVRDAGHTVTRSVREGVAHYFIHSKK